MTDPRVVAEIIRQGRRTRRPRRYINTAFRTGIVESNLENLPGGDADSYGFRQQRESIYGRQGLRRQVRNLFREFEQLDRGQRRGELAADVQRPAAQYRGRYSDAQVKAQARRLTRQALGGPGAAGGTRARRVFSMTMGRPGSVSVSRETSFDKAGFEQAETRAFLAERLGTSRDSILFKSGLLSTAPPNPQDFTSSRLVSKLTPARMPTLTGRSVPGLARSGADPAGQVGSAIRAARKRLGIAEVDGSNRGGKVDKWERKFGMVGQPWCGIFAGVVLQKAGVRGVTPSIASVAAIEADARAGRGPFEAFVSTKRARAGDLLITSKGQHVAVVERVDRDGTIHVIGGNQGDGRVSRGTYRPGEGYGIARVRYRRR